MYVFLCVYHIRSDQIVLHGFYLYKRDLKDDKTLFSLAAAL